MKTEIHQPRDTKMVSKPPEARREGWNKFSLIVGKEPSLLSLDLGLLALSTMS